MDQPKYLEPIEVRISKRLEIDIPTFQHNFRQPYYRQNPEIDQIFANSCGDTRQAFFSDQWTQTSENKQEITEATNAWLLGKTATDSIPINDGVDDAIWLLPPNLYKPSAALLAQPQIERPQGGIPGYDPNSSLRIRTIDLVNGTVERKPVPYPDFEIPKNTNTDETRPKKIVTARRERRLVHHAERLFAEDQEHYVKKNLENIDTSLLRRKDRKALKKSGLL